MSPDAFPPLRAVLLDIEGTVGDIAFVREVLFPYARARIADTLSRAWDEPAIRTLVDEARAAGGRALTTPQDAAAQFLDWMNEDKKITPLKTLQGLIWREGYETGALKAHLYQDAIAAMRAWHAQGLKLFIYSSGSIDAQKLYFRFSVAGDLSGLIAGFFDTTSGAKTESASYARIARATGMGPADILFLSDAAAEIEAAHSAGLYACLVARAGAPAQPFIESFTSLNVRRKHP